MRSPWQLDKCHGPVFTRQNMQEHLGAAGDHVNGIHEVMGSIPISSTNSNNNLARRRIGEAADLSISCPSWREHPETVWDFLEPRAR